MAADQVNLWADEVREKLLRWALWARGNQLVRGTRNVLVDMMQRAAGEVLGGGLGTIGLPLEIEAVEKAIARLRLDAANQEVRQKRYMRQAKRVLMSTYLGNLSVFEIAERLDCSENHVRALLWYAESYVGRVIPEIEEDLRRRQNSAIFRRV